MMLSACDGSYINSSMATAYDRIAEQYRAYRRYETSETETRVVAALVTVAGRLGDEERAVLAGAEPRNGDPDDDEATRIVRDHGFTPDRLVAMRGLARSRDVELEAVLRAALRGELRDIVKLPPVAPVP